MDHRAHGRGAALVAGEGGLPPISAEDWTCRSWRSILSRSVSRFRFGIGVPGNLGVTRAATSAGTTRYTRAIFTVGS